jgi:hypothetical protein
MISHMLFICSFISGVMMIYQWVVVNNAAMNMENICLSPCFYFSWVDI